MGNISPADYQMMQQRLAPKVPTPPACENPVPLEIPFHNEVMEWADNQQPWPWPYIHSRTDRKSTIGNGVHDLTLFGPFPLCVLIEAKARNEKQERDQLIWAAKLRRQGWVVHVARCMADVLAAVNAERVKLSSEAAKGQT